mmetsp:Transcript_22766/g.34498  ORF Transcript_22766/g.34498 Transcript_22766/m.34498 type:complete len:338 (-) Transcript_22766:8-1021(-)
MGNSLRLCLSLLFIVLLRTADCFSTKATTSSTIKRNSRVATPTSLTSRGVASCLLANNNEDDSKSSGFDLSSIPRPTVTQLLSAWLIAVAGNRIMESLPAVLADGNNSLLPNIAFNAILLIGGLYTLIQAVVGIDYAKLEDLDTQSWAREAGIFASEGTVPNEFMVDGKPCQVATFAGGCFWGTELRFQRQVGVIATAVGYTQGNTEKPNYEQVCSGSTGHTEGIQVLYDPTQISYGRLVNLLLDSIPDLTLVNQVGNDRGTQYRHGIYYHTNEQERIGTETLQSRQSQYGDSNKRIATELKPAQVFWPAENYHQRYLEKGGQSAEKNCEEKVKCYG